MNIIRQYIKKRKIQFSCSILFAIFGVVAGLISYMILASLIAELINGNSNWELYSNKLLIITGLFLIKEISAGISTTISHTATFQSLRDIRKEISNKLFEMPLGDITGISSGTLKDIIVDKVDSMETTLSHILPEFNQSNTSYQKYSDSVNDNAQFYYDWMRRCMKRVSIGRILSPMGILTVIPFGMIFYKNGSIEIETLITIVILSFATVSNLLKALNYTDDLARIGTISSGVESLLASKKLKCGTTVQTVENFNVEFIDVSFSYNGKKQVIKNLNLKFDEGTFNALVGESGSGKSTIAKLLAGFWNVESGHIKIGGIDVNNIPLKQLSKLISYVSQDNYLFDFSVKENIRLGNPNATDDEVEQIAIKAGCDRFIKELSHGYDTIVGEGGGHLSGGEKQRISIARAMLKNSPIIILDEATSYIDPENENIIQAAISKLIKGKTLIVIAHRLNTIKGADKIFVINNGMLENSGKHEELLEKSKSYCAMCMASNKEDEA